MKKCFTAQELVDLQLKSLPHFKSNVISETKKSNISIENVMDLVNIDDLSQIMKNHGIPMIYYSDNGNAHNNHRI